MRLIRIGLIDDNSGDESGLTRLVLDVMSEEEAKKKRDERKINYREKEAL